jgi:hypothetical protein
MAPKKKKILTTVQVVDVNFGGLEPGGLFFHPCSSAWKFLLQAYSEILRIFD